MISKPPKLFFIFAICRKWRQIFRLLVFAVLLLADGELVAKDIPPTSSVVFTNILEVRRAVITHGLGCGAVRLEGVVLWVSPTRDEFIFQDATAGVAVKMSLTNQPAFEPGERVRLEGAGVIGSDGIADQPLIDNDGLHSGAEKSETAFFSAGLHPFFIEWFNGPAEYELSLDWATAHLHRQHVPTSAFFRDDPDASSGKIGGSLNYRYYEGEWKHVPDFSQLPVVKSGSFTNFNLHGLAHTNNIGMVISGYLDVPQDGQYQLWLRSDDGAKIFFGNGRLRLTDLGRGVMPLPREIFPGQAIPAEQDSQWAEVEGVITRVSESYGGLNLELSTSMGQAYLRVLAREHGALTLLPQSRIRTLGICQNARSVDGQSVPSLWVEKTSDITVEEVAEAQWLDHPLISLGSLTDATLPKTRGELIHASGKVIQKPGDKFLTLADKTGEVLFSTTQSPPGIGDQIEALGWYDASETNGSLQIGFYRTISQLPGSNPAALPLLTEAIQVKSLNRAEAARGYPVKIQGVITYRGATDYVLQDATASVYLLWANPDTRELPRIGDYWEMEGESTVEFAPNVRVHRATYLRPGVLPEPLHPTGEELINGSLDTKFVEIRGIATSIEKNIVTLLTRDGTVKLRLTGLDTNSLTDCEGALVRVRGICAPGRDKNQRLLPPLELLNASIVADEFPPANPFAAPLKHASDLLLFDANADNLRRVKIAGQVTQERQDEYFLMDGINGFRCEPKLDPKLEPGELIEAVGFPDISGPSPVLHEAVMRRLGKANLPPAVPLAEDALLNGKLDATLVEVQARLVGLSMQRTEQVMELQTGNRTFNARLPNRHGLLSGLLPGSKLALTGVYMGEGGDRASSREIDSFELLLDSPDDIRVLARPSWWNIRHALTVMCGMLVVLLLALVWITMLRRQVEERSRQLTAEIKSREQAEHQRALEGERARIAQDLHDDLGATLTEIRFLSAVESCDSLVPTATRTQMRKVSEKSHQLVSSLDEIVWAVNPANDSLSSLANYLCHVAEEFFRTTSIRCRLDVDESLPPMALNSEVRHNLCLSVREALNNIAKHSHATEAWLRIHWQRPALDIAVEDNGIGFVRGEREPSGNGLKNLRRRMEMIGGQFECESRAGEGTVCRIHLAFN
jgi:signal transduction histidine kinase